MHQVLDEDTHMNETRSVVTIARLGQRKVSLKTTILQANLKPHRTRLKMKGKHLDGKKKLTKKARATMEKQRRKILLLWEYSSLGKFHFTLSGDALPERHLSLWSLNCLALRISFYLFLIPMFNCALLLILFFRRRPREFAHVGPSLWTPGHTNIESTGDE